MLIPAVRQEVVQCGLQQAAPIRQQDRGYAVDFWPFYSNDYCFGICFWMNMQLNNN